MNWVVPGAIAPWIFMVGFVVGMAAVLGAQKLSAWRGGIAPDEQGTPLTELPAPSEADLATKAWVDGECRVVRPGGSGSVSFSYQGQPIDFLRGMQVTTITGLDDRLRFGAPEMIIYDPRDWCEPLRCNGANCPSPEITPGQVIWTIPIEGSWGSSMPCCLDCIDDPNDGLFLEPLPTEVAG